MVGAGALEVDASVAVDEGFFADDHGVDERGLARRPELVHLGDDATVQAAAPGGDAASGKAGEAFDIFYFGGGQRGDAAIGEVSLIVEGAGIAEIARELELGGEADAVAVVEDWNGCGGRVRFGGFFRGCVVRARAVDVQADAGVNGFALACCGLNDF